MSREFFLDDPEQDAAEEFVVTHQCSIEYEGAIGGAISYTFTDTSIGTAITVSCACGAQENITDYAKW